MTLSQTMDRTDPEDKRWVTREALPSIRRTGQYAVGQPSTCTSEVRKAWDMQSNCLVKRVDRVR